MDSPEIARVARDFAVMVRVCGPDPKSLKTRRSAFHLHRSGVTTLSASGVLLPAGSLNNPPPVLDHVRSICGHSGDFVLTAASLVEPFLVAEQRNNPSHEFDPKLISNARIDVLIEGEKTGDNGSEASTTPCCVPSQLFALVDVPASCAAILSMLASQSGSTENLSWDVGWSLALLTEKQGRNGIMHSFDSSDNSSDPSLMVKLATRIAILGISTLDHQNTLHIDVSQLQERGDLLLVMGSPFGVLSPLHFLNSISVGAVANCFPPGSFRSALLMADIYCLPGMEGGPVFDRNACLVGMLMSPLTQKGSNTEIQLVITWDAFTTAWDNEHPKETLGVSYELDVAHNKSEKKELLVSYDNFRRSLFCSTKDACLCSVSPSSFKRAISSVVLVTIDASWASGIIINNQGLILTNAHLLEPWRFGRTSSLGQIIKPTTLFELDQTFWQKYQNADSDKKENLLHLLSRGSCYLQASKHQAVPAELINRNCKKISVHLDHSEGKTWCKASVLFVSKGPLDVALLQLESIPSQLCAINPEFICPLPGASVHVIGHGLLGPRSGLCPSVSSGVVSNVFRIPGPLHLCHSTEMEIENSHIPVMLQTTAAVHPGASGGALINSHGQLIGLITSNARHGSGRSIPHLNFSIPCKPLERIFKFADEGDLSILQQLDCPNELLSSVWALAPPASLLPKLHREEESKGRGGSRFAKFLEQHSELSSRQDVNPLREKLPSKI